MTFLKHTLFAIGLLCLGIVQAWATPTSNPNKPHSALVTVSWVGGTAGFETDWNTGANWSTGNVPGSGDNVSINGSLTHYPILNNNTTIQSLNVQTGASLTINAGRTLTISGAGTGLSLNSYGTISNNGTIAITATSDAFQLDGNSNFTNNGTLTVTTTGNYGIKINGSATLTNQTAGMINSTGTSGSFFQSGGSNTVNNHGKMTLTGQIEKYTGTFHNYPCGVVNLTSGEVYNNGGQLINEGFFSAPANLNGTAADFINDGIIYIGGGSASYTNNKIRIFNNAASTGIFEFAGGNDLIVEGIYKDEAALTTAGSYNQITNTFTPVGVPGGTQTLYAKITRSSVTCPQIVPFSINLPGFITQPVAQSICPGTNAVFSVTSTGLTSYQWQESADAAFTSPVNISTGGIYTVSSTTDASSLTVAHNAGVNGKYYRCVGSPGGYASDAALLTVLAGPFAGIAYPGSPYNNIGTAPVTLTGTMGGTFSATPSGLSLNTTSGEIDLAASTPQMYTVTYTSPLLGGCPAYVATATLVIRNAALMYVWTGAISNQWHNTGNWLVNGTVPSVLPAFGSTRGNPVQIPVVGNGRYPEVTTAEGARTVAIAANASLTVKTAGNLKIVGSDLDGITNAGTFTNNGTVLIDSSYNDGFVNQTGASLINTNALTIQMGTGNRLENYGSINNSGTFTVGGGLATAILNHPAATLTNTSTFAVSDGLTGGMLNQGTVDNSGQFTVRGGVSGTLFINQETVTNHAGATMTIGNHDSLIFDNQKLVENEGNLNIRGGKDRGAINRQGATIRNKAGGKLDANGTAKTLFRNGGLIENYHIATFSGTPDTCFYNLPTGEVKNEATFTQTGTNRAIINLGKFTHGSAGILNFSGMGGIAFKNGGTFLSTAGCVITNLGSITDLLLNLPNAVFENKCATTFSSGNKAIVNQGRYTHTAGSFTAGQMGDVLQNSDYAEINVPFTSTGSMGKFFVNSDTLILGPQTTVTTSPNPFSTHGTPLTNTGTGYVYSQADFNINSTTTLIDNAGKMVLGSQSTLIGKDMGTPIINTGNLINEGSFNFNRFGGYGIDNSGTFVNKGRFETGNSDKSIHNNGGTIENAGVMEIDSVFRDAVLQKGSGSSFTNTATGQINIDFVFGNGINNTAGSFVNNGEMMIAQTDTVALSGINNAGTFQNNKLMRIGGAGKIKAHGIYNTGTLTNTTDSRIILQSAEGSGITNQGGAVTNQSCAYIESTPVILNAAGTFSNAGVITKHPDNAMIASNISTNSGSIVNEDTDAFTVTGTNSGTFVGSASIAYVGSPYVNTGTAAVTLTGATGGTFSATPSGLSLNPTTGEINLAASTPQSYIVTYAIAAAGGSCPAMTDTAVVQIMAPNQIIYVNASNINATQDGSSWGTAFASLSAGLSAAALQSKSVQVWVAQGTYKPGTLRRDVFTIPSGVEVYGGFVGSETQLSERNWNINKTILSGEIGTSSLSDNVNHVVLFNQTNAATRLDGFTIERGFADFVSPNQNGELTDVVTLVSSGGGIAVINKSRGLITNCVITNNKAITGGGIFLSDSSRVSVTKSIIWGNEATFGGGVYVLGGSTSALVNVLIVNNKGLGGGMYINRSSPELVNCTLSSNQGTNGTAGGIFNTNSSATVKNSIVWGNSTPQSTPGIAMTYSLVEGGFTGTGNLNRNPLFVNASPNGLAPLGGLGDYHLQVCSPAINAGDNAGAPLEDMESNARPYPAGIGIVDMGVYESQSTGGGGPATLTVSEPITGGTVQKSAGRLTATNQVTGGVVEYRGGLSVMLMPGFSVSDATFLAIIGGCETVVPTNSEGVQQK